MSQAALEAHLARAHARLRTCAVTGTNGKTSTVTFVASICAELGPFARLTTLGAQVGDEAIGGRGTAQFVAFVDAAIAAGVQTAAIEMTSKALAGGLAKRWPPHVAVFTNLSRDHLEMHGSPEAYLAAKAQLFMALGPHGVAVLNRDDENALLLDEVIAPSVRRLWYGRREDADLRYGDVSDDGACVRFRVCSKLLPGLERIELGAAGAYQASNAAAAALGAYALGHGSEAIAAGLARPQPLIGRFQVIARRPLVVVDYAHTPDGLRAALRAMERHRRTRIHCVFGCGGERDQGKRAAMGAVADELADVVWLTSDNPRSEDPSAIADAIEPKDRRARWHRELDRRRAIEAAVAEAMEDDAVLIAGKGHEREQVGRVARAFDDAEEARRALGQRRT